jgi:choline dehydrogenase
MIAERAAQMILEDAVRVGAEARAAELVE